MFILRRFSSPFAKIPYFIMKSLPLIALLYSVSAQQVIEISVTYLTPWAIGDKVPIECPKLDSIGNQISKLDQNNLTVLDYGPAPICLETGEPMYVLYGIDAMSSCGWAVDQTFYNHLRQVVSGHAQFSCRIAIAKEQQSSSKTGMNLFLIAYQKRRCISHSRYRFGV